MRALSIRGLTKIYGNGVQALKGIDLDVEEGEFCALLGPNGAGKTTTIGVITSLVNKSSGTVSVFGHDIDRELTLAKSCIGLVPQEITLNLFEQIINVVVTQAGYYGLNRTVAMERAERYLTQLQLWDRRNDIARNLSGGMKRRLMIARALIHEPRLLILDEPTAGVDIEIRRSMWKFLREINQQGTTIILTTHYLEEAESLCRHVAIIDEGEIRVNDRMSRVLRKLSVETFVLNLEQEITAAPVIDGYDLRLVDPQTIEADVESHRGINDLFSRLTEQGLRVVSMRNKANRLEELFIRLVESKEAARLEQRAAP